MEIITVPRTLRNKIGDDGSDALVELLNKSNESQKEDLLVFVEEKFESRLTEEVSKVNQRISESNANMIKWMFIFWIGQIGAMVAILFAFFNK